MGFSEDMRNTCSVSWQQAVQHQFTKELKEKSLASDVFTRYLLQDYAFLSALLSAFGHCLGHAPDLSAKKRLSVFMNHLCLDEIPFFIRSFQDLGVAADVFQAYEAPFGPRVKAGPHGHPALTDTTIAFKELLTSTSLEGYAQGLAALVPCEWIYQTWAAASDGDQQQQQHQHEATAEDAWRKLHTDNAFQEFVGWLRGELDREAAATNEHTRQQLAEIFAKVVDLEVAFFSAAYTGRG
ncbi:hypothetical protein DUNSADRAFT_2771 [Dunaliella salina]|uniref:Thiaminase-2/PQQC domain-containing protein n=1 Tax=Dunaliella salina TaxID=3046 RepID=A0ABQ7GV53_DUNSA|nr:hypothetical protein DUNSADRAFT_2771 [Dunaliella salina]|eukprot:KAF5838501.1 hypothetical protein DUNSADRAFT_2771 [Dunaliella salina]